MSLDLHHIKNSESSCSYFVKRPFGNYIIFADELGPIHVDFFQSKGGVYKQFIENPTTVNANQKSLFIKFGATGLCAAPLDQCSEEIPFEFWGKGFKDPMIKFRVHGDLQMVLLKQNDKKLAFLGQGYFYKDSKDILVGGVKKTDEIFDKLEAEGVSVVFFSRYSWDHMAEI